VSDQTIDEEILNALRVLPRLVGEFYLVRDTLDVRFNRLEALLQQPTPPPISVPVAIKLALPTITKDGKDMANLEILNDTVVTVPIMIVDDEGNPVLPPPSDVFTPVSSDLTKLEATIGATATGSQALILKPLVRGWVNGSVVVSDSAGLQTVTQGIDIVEDFSPSKLTLDVDHVTTTHQDVPAA
jgi:hypothetical protein